MAWTAGSAVAILMLCFMANLLGFVGASSVPTPSPSRRALQSPCGACGDGMETSAGRVGAARPLPGVCVLRVGVVMAATVLVVEDEREIRELLRRYPERAGYGVLTTGAGAEAVRLLGERGIDLPLLDLGLPDVDGDEVRHARPPAPARVPLRPAHRAVAPPRRCRRSAAAPDRRALHGGRPAQCPGTPSPSAGRGGTVRSTRARARCSPLVPASWTTAPPGCLPTSSACAGSRCRPSVWNKPGPAPVEPYTRIPHRV